jgi:hypothetical protein
MVYATAGSTRSMENGSIYLFHHGEVKNANPGIRELKSHVEKQ